MERLILLTTLAFLSAALQAQQVERHLREGNARYENGDMPGAVQAYSMAEADERGLFNRGNAYYRQDSLADATQAYEQAASMARTPQAQAKAYHNLGNSHMGQKNYQEAVQAYQEALKRIPSDEDTRYNLAYAQKMLAAQQKQQQQQGKNKNDQQQDQQKKDQQKKEQQKKDQQQEGKQREQDKRQGDKQEPPQDRIDPKDAKRMLDAAQQQEKEVQNKVRKLMQPKPAQPAEKDW